MCTATPLLGNRREVVRDVPISLQVSGVLAGRAVTLWAERACKTGMILVSEKYIRPRSVIDAVLTIPGESEPLKAFLSVTYVELSSRGYGIGVQFVGLSAAAQERWTRIHGMARGLYGRQLLKRNLVPPTPRLLVTSQALSHSAIQTLLQHQLDIQTISQPSDLTEAVARGDVDQVMLDLSQFDDSWASAFRQARRLLPGLRLWLLSGSDFEAALRRGRELSADVVVAKPCSHEALAARLRTELPLSLSSAIEYVAATQQLHA